MKKIQVLCDQHSKHGISPRMLTAGHTPSGAKMLVCAVCGSVREFGESTILKLCNGYGFILGESENVFFHFGDLDGYTPAVGDHVSFEVVYFDDGKKKAVNIKPLNEGGVGYDRERAKHYN